MQGLEARSVTPRVRAQASQELTDLSNVTGVLTSRTLVEAPCPHAVYGWNQRPALSQLEDLPNSTLCHTAATAPLPLGATTP